MDSFRRFVEDFSDIPLPTEKLTEKDAYFIFGVLKAYQARANALLDREQDAQR